VLRRIVAPCFLFTFLVLANIALAQEFSADVVSQKSDNVGMKKVYAARDKVRFEVQGANRKWDQAQSSLMPRNIRIP
jgi:hypothetical protein